MKILNFGSCNIDLVYNVESIVRPGETIKSAMMNQYPGGKGLNQSIALAKSGGTVWHAGCIGEDGAFLADTMAQNGVHIEFLKTVNDRTGHAIIQNEKSGENCIVIYSGANGCVTNEYVDEVMEQFALGDFLLLQNEINNIPYIIKKAKEKGLKIVLNPSPFNADMKKIDLRDISYLLLNEVEASCFSQIEDPYDSILWMTKRYPNLSVVLTLGKKGCLYNDGGKIFHHPTFKVKPVDTTAAGDTFTGYFISMLCAGKPLFDCVKLASCAAAISTTKKGAAPSIPYYADVVAAMPNMKMYDNDCDEWKKGMVNNYVLQHVQDASLSELADLLHYSTSYLSRWIEKNMGQSFTELVQTERCRVAEVYLRETNLTVNEIIQKVGYSNEGFFRKKFVQLYKMLPADYRNTLKK